MLIVNEVRMLVIYSQWVQVITAKTTRSYVTSIIEGWDDIADQMEIYQTPWFNFVDILGQQGLLLCTLAQVELQGPFAKTRTPLSSIPNMQSPESRKRTLEGSSELHERKKRRHTA
jgi:hypothetical protein